jgi:hypothetical protein
VESLGSVDIAIATEGGGPLLTSPSLTRSAVNSLEYRDFLLEQFSEFLHESQDNEAGEEIAQGNGGDNSYNDDHRQGGKRYGEQKQADGEELISIQQPQRSSSSSDGDLVGYYPYTPAAASHPVTATLEDASTRATAQYEQHPSFSSGLEIGDELRFGLQQRLLHNHADQQQQQLQQELVLADSKAAATGLPHEASEEVAVYSDLAGNIHRTHPHNHHDYEEFQGEDSLHGGTIVNSLHDSDGELSDRFFDSGIGRGGDGLEAVQEGCAMEMEVEVEVEVEVDLPVVDNNGDENGDEKRIGDRNQQANNNTDDIIADLVNRGILLLVGRRHSVPPTSNYDHIAMAAATEEDDGYGSSTNVDADSGRDDDAMAVAMELATSSTADTATIEPQHESIAAEQSKEETDTLRFLPAVNETRELRSYYCRISPGMAARVEGGGQVSTWCAVNAVVGIYSDGAGPPCVDAILHAVVGGGELHLEGGRSAATAPAVSRDITAEQQEGVVVNATSGQENNRSISPPDGYISIRFLANFFYMHE